MFDERRVSRGEVERAIETYRRLRPKHHPARSAFLLDNGERLPAKLILRLAYENTTGEPLRSDQLTGGRASVRVLKNLGFDAIYDKPKRPANRSLIKNARREALRRVLAARWGEVQTEVRLDNLFVPSLSTRDLMAPELSAVLEAIESVRGTRVYGRERHRLCCDLYLPAQRLIIEFDEKQHFTLPRAASLRAYPRNVRLAFDRERWIRLSSEIRAGDHNPPYRDEQRAFYDSVRDLLAPELGYLPVLRLFENDVLWEQDAIESPQARAILSTIEDLVS